MKVNVQVKELNAENVVLKGKAEALKIKFSSLETNNSLTHPT